MTRSPLAYPLNRAADMDVGGAADLQTDIMRFMAILSLCLVAIFALVQSIPLTPTEPEPVSATAPAGGGSPASQPKPVAAKALPVRPKPVAAKAPPVKPKPVAATTPPAKPKPVAARAAPTAPAQVGSPATRPEPIAAKAPPAEPEPVAATAPPTQPTQAEPEGFTLRFASDAALTRAVAAHHVGFYAIDAGIAKRMTVSESRISFWDASTPNAFHEMEAATVPSPVVDALARTGVATGNVDWGVTLPGKMKSQLDTLMSEHRGGSLVIGAAGEIHWEAQ